MCHQVCVDDTVEAAMSVRCEYSSLEFNLSIQKDVQEVIHAVIHMVVHIVVAPV